MPVIVGKVPAELLQACMETDFAVHHVPQFSLRVGEQSPGLLGLFDKTNALCAAYLTAYDPFGERRLASENRMLQAALEEQLKKRGMRFIAGASKHPSEKGLGEPRVLVLDLDLAAATALARHYEQSVLIWCGRDGVPQLVAV